MKRQLLARFQHSLDVAAESCMRAKIIFWTRREERKDIPDH
jgi:hypothetical protein